MDTRVRYLLILAAYIAVMIVAGTAVTVRFTDLDPVDSFYYVVQTLWTVGYGDVVPAGDVGKSITLALNFFGTVGVLSAIGIVSGIVLDRFIVRQRRVEEEASRRLAQMREAVFRWADENGVDREAVEEVLGHERHRCRTHQMERAGGGVPCGFDGGLLSS